MPSVRSLPRVAHRLIVATAALAVLVAVGAGPVTAQEAPLPPPIDPEAVRVAIDLYRNRARLDEVNRELLGTTARLAAAEAELAETLQRIAVVTAEVEELEAELVGRAAEAYQRRGGELGTYLAIEHVRDPLIGERYTNAAAYDGGQKLEKLAALQAVLEQERAARAATRQAIANDKARLDALRAELEAATARDAELLERFGAVSVLGDAQVSATQLAAWFRAQGGRARLPEGATIEEVAQLYVEEGGAEQVRGDVAFAQAVIETGSFGHTRGNNYAGIGNCDSCGGQGIMFPTPREGVRAQVQHLRNYADPTSRADRLASPPVPALYGLDLGAAAASFDGFFAKGTAPVWNVMGNGNWATDPYYAGKVLGVYAQILGYAALHP